MTSGLYFSHPACLAHDPRVFAPGHPDTPERLLSLEHALAARDWLGWERREAPAASETDLELVHTGAHVRRVRELCAAGGGMIDPDTFVVEDSYRAALHAAGAVRAMTEALVGGESRRGFCGIRPAGHHAEPDRAMGFCLFDNVAVAAAFAIAELGLRRVLILDWDVHAGNGTAEIFRRRADVLFVCIHEHGLFPGTGPLGDNGSGEGEGHTVNLPVPPGSEEDLWLSLLDRVAIPLARAFEPELVLVSAGFDAHVADPLARCRLRTGSFAEMARRVRDLADGLDSPLGLVLEGGYQREVLAECVAATLDAVSGAEPPSPAVPPSDPVARELLERALGEVGRGWGPRARQPKNRRAVS